LKPRIEFAKWAAALAVLVLAFAPPARAAPGFEITAGYGSQWLTGQNDDLVSTTDVFSQFFLSAAMQPVKSAPPFWLELDYLYGSSNAPVYTVGAAGLGMNHFELSAVYRRMFHWAHLGWFVRGGPTVTFGRLTLQDNSNNEIASESQVEPGLTAAGGLELALYKADDDGLPGEEGHRRAGAGVRAEFGYRWQPDFNFNGLTPTGLPSTPGVIQVPTSIGSISGSGFEARLALFVRF
jgi:hypothetical protein